MTRSKDGWAGPAGRRGGGVDLDARRCPRRRHYAQRRGGGGGGSRGSVRSVNRNPSGNGGSWSGAHSSGTTQRTTSGNSSSRSTTAQTRSGETVNANRNVTKSGDEVTVNRNAQSTSGASKSSQKTYDMDDGRVESVERNTQATSRSGQTASWEGKAEREGYGWEFEGEGKNRYGQKVEAEGYGARGPYGSGVVADVEGGPLRRPHGRGREGRTAAPSTRPSFPTARGRTTPTAGPTTRTAAPTTGPTRTAASTTTATCRRRGAATTRPCPWARSR